MACLRRTWIVGEQVAAVGHPPAGDGVEQALAHLLADVARRSCSRFVEHRLALQHVDVDACAWPLW